MLFRILRTVAASPASDSHFIADGLRGAQDLSQQHELAAERRVELVLLLHMLRPPLAAHARLLIAAAAVLDDLHVVVVASLVVVVRVRRVTGRRTTQLAPRLRALYFLFLLLLFFSFPKRAKISTLQKNTHIQ